MRASSASVMVRSTADVVTMTKISAPWWFNGSVMERCPCFTAALKVPTVENCAASGKHAVPSPPLGGGGRRRKRWRRCEICETSRSIVTANFTANRPLQPCQVPPAASSGRKSRKPKRASPPPRRLRPNQGELPRALQDRGATRAPGLCPCEQGLAFRGGAEGREPAEAAARSRAAPSSSRPATDRPACRISAPSARWPAPPWCAMPSACSPRTRCRRG